MSKGTQPRFVRQMTLAQFDQLFPNEEACWTYLFEQRWPNGVRCVRCGNDHVYRGKGARFWSWQCMKCGPKPRSPYRFTLKTGTVFEESKKPLLQWFKVLHLMLTSKKGISALQIHRMLGYGSYKTSWYMCMRLRGALHDPAFRKLMGVVEVDETYFGGKWENRHKKDRFKGGRGTAGKIPVIGAISRKGSVVCAVIENTDTRTLDSFVRKTVDREQVELVATDEHSGYRLLSSGGKQFGLPHEVIKHSTGEYVRGVVHTNNIESFWSLLKRGVMGTYHNVSKKYLPLYLAEFQFRFNNRAETDIFGKAVAGC